MLAALSLVLLSSIVAVTHACDGVTQHCCSCPDGSWDSKSWVDIGCGVLGMGCMCHQCEPLTPTPTPPTPSPATPTPTPAPASPTPTRFQTRHSTPPGTLNTSSPTNTPSPIIQCPFDESLCLVASMDDCCPIDGSETCRNVNEVICTDCRCLIPKTSSPSTGQEKACTDQFGSAKQFREDAKKILACEKNGAGKCSALSGPNLDSCLCDGMNECMDQNGYQKAWCSEECRNWWANLFANEKSCELKCPLSTLVIVGIAAGGVFGLGLVVAAIGMCIIRQRRKTSSSDTPYLRA